MILNLGNDHVCDICDSVDDLVDQAMRVCGEKVYDVRDQYKRWKSWCEEGPVVPTRCLHTKNV